jgi:3-oxoacyl-[acyl-carrier protein] reductase
VSSATDVATVVQTATDEYGGVDTLVNNAGIIDDSRSLEDTSEEVWHRVLDVNMTGVYLLTREALTHLIESDGGVVVNIASIAGKVAGGGGIAYTASKHGVIGFTKQLAHEYGPEVRANAICPGFIESGMTQGLIEHRPDRVEKLADSTPAQRPGTPEDVANVATFLASDDADFVHGAAVNVDGGWLVD